MDMGKKRTNQYKPASSTIDNGTAGSKNGGKFRAATTQSGIGMLVHLFSVTYFLGVLVFCTSFCTALYPTSCPCLAAPYLIAILHPVVTLLDKRQHRTAPSSAHDGRVSAAQSLLASRAEGRRGAGPSAGRPAWWSCRKRKRRWRQRLRVRVRVRMNVRMRVVRRGPRAYCGWVHTHAPASVMVRKLQQTNKPLTKNMTTA